MSNLPFVWPLRVSGHALIPIVDAEVEHLVWDYTQLNVNGVVVSNMCVIMRECITFVIFPPGAHPPEH